MPVDEKTCAAHRKEIEENIDDVELQVIQLKTYVSTLKAPAADLGHAPEPDPSIRGISEAIRASIRIFKTQIRLSKL